MKHAPQQGGGGREGGREINRRLGGQSSSTQLGSLGCELSLQFSAEEHSICMALAENGVERI